LTSARPSDPPGEAFHYFNYNYTTLGLLIEELSGLSYPEYVEKGIFRPLGMGDSRMLPQRAADRGGELPEAEGHGNLFGFPYPVPTERSAHCGPSGGLVTTAGDLALYARAHLAGGNGSGGGAPLLSPDGFASLHRPGIGDREAGYAMGWITSLHRGRELLRHGGSLPGYRSFLWLLPEEELGIVVLLNQNGFLPAVLAYSSIPAGIADLMLGYEPDRPFPLRALYWGVSVLMLLLLGLHLRWWLRRRRRLRREPGGASRRRRRREAVMIAGELLLAGAVVLAVPRGAELLLDRGMSWQLGFTMAPAAMSLLAWPAVAAAGRALGRGSALFFPASD
jgi:CubicO group peptidase (beta-lactamase class C family)